MHATRSATLTLALVAAALSATSRIGVAGPEGPPAPIAAPPDAVATPGPIVQRRVSEHELVSSLREIGRVRATTHFCSSLRSDTELAANAAVAFEVGALATIRDIVAFSAPPNRLVKARLQRTLEDDLRNLADLSRTGGTELSQLRDLARAATPDERRAVLGLHDALDGAKARQHAMVEVLAHTVGEYDETEPASPIDSDEGAFIELQGASTHTRNTSVGASNVSRIESDTLPSDLLGNVDLISVLDAGSQYANLLPDDGRIRSDLATAAASAMRAVELGSCSVDRDTSHPLTEAVRP